MAERKPFLIRVDRDVLDVGRLDARRGLHLDERAAPVAPLEDVGADQHVAVRQRGFEEQAIVAARQRLARVAQRPAEVVDVTDQPPARSQPARDLPDAIAGVEARLRGRVDDGEVAPVRLQPEPLRALAVRHQPGLGKRACHGRSIGDRRLRRRATPGRRSASPGRRRPAAPGTAPRSALSMGDACARSCSLLQSPLDRFA